MRSLSEVETGYGLQGKTALGTCGICLLGIGVAKKGRLKNLFEGGQYGRWKRKAGDDGPEKTMDKLRGKSKGRRQRGVQQLKLPDRGKKRPGRRYREISGGEERV